MLTIVCVVDPEVRATVLKKFSKGFDKHLAQPMFVRLIIMALNDGDFSNREIAANLLGSLAKQNLVYIVPSLRRTLSQLMTELEYSPSMWVHYLVLFTALHLLTYDITQLVQGRMLQNADAVNERFTMDCYLSSFAND